MFKFSNKKALSNKLKCLVKLLTPEDEIELDYTNDTLGQEIFNEVVRELCLLDRDYYGLKIPQLSQWLDFNKPLAKQVKGIYEVTLELRFKYYPATPALLPNELTRYYLYLQLRIDLIEGRLVSNSHDIIAYLIACIMQSELGDYNTENENENYVAEFKFVPNQTEDLEWSAIRYHKNEDFQGLTPPESELNFLKKASSLDTYGIDPYPVKEGSSKNHFLIGVNYRGISTFQDSKKVNQFNWPEIERISLDNKVVLIYCIVCRLDKKNSKTKTLFGFRCPSTTYAHNFWRIATEHKFFFTLESKPETPIVSNTGGLFKKSHKLKYAGRVEKDLLREPQHENQSIRVKRSHSLITKANDGPRWQGFQQGDELQNSLSSKYASDSLNKTMPPNLRCFGEEQEEEEDEVEDCSSLPHSTNQRPSISVYSESRKRTSVASIRESSTHFTRRPILTTKNNCNENKATFMDANQRTKNFLITTGFLILTIFTFLLVTLLINDSTRPNSMTLLVRKIRLESISVVLQQNYYLPLKASVRRILEQLLTLAGQSHLIT